jgi:hypothetical protein
MGARWFVCATSERACASRQLFLIDQIVAQTQDDILVERLCMMKTQPVNRRDFYYREAHNISASTDRKKARPFYNRFAHKHTFSFTGTMRAVLGE